MSRAADGKLIFGEYLPDLAVSDNPGLTEALNVLPIDKTYKPYHPIIGSGDALDERPTGGIACLDASGNALLYVGTDTSLNVRAGTSWTDKSQAVYASPSGGYWRFAQYDTLVIATNYEEVPQAIEAGDAGNFVDLAVTGTAPNARHIGVVGQHLVLGDTNDATNGAVPYRIQWSRIGDPTEWPVPNSADARAKQSGEQFLPSALGAVTGIVGNDQFGIILQKGGCTRMTYIGGDEVYQIDTYDTTDGAAYPNATVKVGDRAYFISAGGFRVTDGAAVLPIGKGRFDRLFTDDVDTGFKERVRGAYDKYRGLIYWAYPGSGSSAGTPNKLIVYNVAEDRITRAQDNVECLIEGLTTSVSIDDLDSLFDSIDDVTPSLDDAYWQGGNEVLQAFTTAYELGTFSGDPTEAVIDGQEVELNPGLMTFLSGVRPIVQGQSAVTVALGYRNAYSDDVTYTPDIPLTPRTGFADFRQEARLFRSRVKVTGDFPAAQGVFFQSQPGGAA